MTTKICNRCGNPFTISFGEEQWYLHNKMTVPSHCVPCRAIRRKERFLSSSAVANFPAYPAGYEREQPPEQPKPVTIVSMLRLFAAKPVSTGANRPGNASKHHIFRFQGKSLCGSHSAMKGSLLADVIDLTDIDSRVVCPICYNTLKEIHANDLRR